MSLADTKHRIGRDNGRLGALRFVDPDVAGSRGPMCGVTVSVKDMIDVRGWPITCNHRPFEDHRAACDAEIIADFRRSGASLVGTSAMLEFAYGGYTERALYPPARNPYAVDRSPGGSSCGAGVAVAAGFCDIAIATDTSGSVREPAALCGVLGLKPGHGAISLHGIQPLASSLDTVGLLARDPALLAKAAAVALRRPMRLSERPLKIGWLYGFDEAAGAGADVAAALRAALHVMRSHGAKVEAVALDHSLMAYHGACIVSLLAEAWRLHRPRLHDRRNDYDPLTWFRLCLGAFIGESDYVEALSLRRMLRSEVDAALGGFDVLVTVGAPSGAAPLSEIDPFAMVRGPFLTSPFSATGHPAIVIPIGFDSMGLPLAMQMVAPFGEEARLLSAARLCQSLGIYKREHALCHDIGQAGRSQRSLD